MRPIDYDPKKITLPDGWAEKATELKGELVAAADVAARTTILRDNPLWSDVKSELRKLSHGKCWYTESIQLGTDVDVDHFRPKKRVAERCAEGDAHPGYWWLAYDLENYRYSCIVANRLRRDVETDLVGGKADRFPIADETIRAMTPDADWQAEKTLLIDPCKADETALITFKEDGEALPRFGPEQTYKNEKAGLSIKYYSLNHSDFTKARIAIRDRIEDLRVEAMRYFSRLETGDADHARAYSNAIMTLRELRKEASPFSAFSIAITDTLRGEEALSGVFI
ncbi:MAG: hypothetical protein EOS28_31240 [Mesorhizobium sp.]|nr:MAG: hypothetical protein EOS28_31240 [Mesorhizobium sp.]